MSVQYQGIEDNQKNKEKILLLKNTKTWYLLLEEYAAIKVQLSDYPEL